MLSAGIYQGQEHAGTSYRPPSSQKEQGGGVLSKLLSAYSTTSPGSDPEHCIVKRILVLDQNTTSRKPWLPPSPSSTTSNPHPRKHIHASVAYGIDFSYVEVDEGRARLDYYVVAATPKDGDQSLIHAILSNSADTAGKAPTPFNDKMIVIISMDWTCLDSFPAHLDAAFNAIAPFHSSVQAIHVIVSGTSFFSTLESQYGFTDAEFDYCQQYLRVRCLEHGAALLYVDDNTIRLVHETVVTSAGLGIGSTFPAAWMDRDKVYIPPLWDSMAKVSTLRDGFDPRQFERVIGRRVGQVSLLSDGNVPRPVSASSTPPVLEHQMLLQKIVEQDTTLHRAASHLRISPTREAAGRQGGGGSGGDYRKVERLPLASEQSESARILAAIAAKEKERQASAGGTRTTEPFSLAPPLSKSIPTSLPARVIDTKSVSDIPAPPEEAQNQVLANFFQSLLSKKSSGGSSSPTINSSAKIP